MLLIIEFWRNQSCFQNVGGGCPSPMLMKEVNVPLLMRLMSQCVPKGGTQHECLLLNLLLQALLSKVQAWSTGVVVDKVVFFLDCGNWNLLIIIGAVILFELLRFEINFYLLFFVFWTYLFVRIVKLLEILCCFVKMRE